MLPRTWKPALVALTFCALASDRQPAGAQVTVDLELMLAVDASGSVSPAEFNLQVQGLAAAFRDPEVIDAIRKAGGIAVAVMQWSSPGQQVVVVNWSAVTDEASAETMAQRIVGAGRLILGETAVDGALRFALAELATNSFSGTRQVIDVSGDGATNWGPLPDRVRDRAVAAGVTINGLAIVNEQENLGRYYREHVIGGPGAFVIVAADYADFARAMRQKLLEEISNRPTADRQRHDELNALAKEETRWKAGATARR